MNNLTFTPRIGEHMSKFLKNITRSCVYLVVVSSICISAKTLAGPAGYIDFADLGEAYGEAKVEINLHKALLNMVGTFSKSEDPEIAEILSGVDSIKVRVFPLNGKPEKAMETVDEVSKKIRKLDWEPLISVNEEKEKVRIFSKMTGEVMDGLVVMVVNENGEGEAVFINIVGQIDPAKVSKLADSMDINMGDIK
jgi:hypothetical protein